MSRLLIASLFLVGLLLTASSAQDVKKDGKDQVEGPPAKKVTPKGVPTFKSPEGVPGDCEIHFLNGSKVRMVVQSDKLEIATLYGKLAVPVKDVRAIEFGLHFPDGMEAQIDQAAKNLGSSDYRTRETASKALIDLGPFSYPAVLEASRTKELEIANRAKEIAKKLQGKHPKKDLKIMVEDRVVTHNFTIVGRILTTSIKAKTEYFGEVDLNLTKMRTMRAMWGHSLDVEFALDAGKYANQGQWYDTGYAVDGRTAITITAKGMIDVWPQQNGQFTSGPNGFRATPNGGNVMPALGRKVAAVNQQQHCGLLLAKIGEDGEIFIVGERFDGIPEHEGKVYLHIGPSQWNVPCIGTYDVKVARKLD